MTKISAKHFGLYKHHRLLVQDVIKHTAKRYGLKPKQLFEKTKRQPIVEARQYAMYILTELNFSQKYVGMVFDLKPTDVFHAIGVIKTRIETKQLLIY